VSAFISLLGGTAAAWPFVVCAQQGERMRRVGVLLNLVAADPEGQARLAAFLQGLQGSGWVDGCNVRIETRWSAGDPNRARASAAELVALAPLHKPRGAGSNKRPRLRGFEKQTWRYRDRLL
jgi:putative ABC transport system substrate-binding protein